MRVAPKHARDLATADFLSQATVLVRNDSATHNLGLCSTQRTPALLVVPSRLTIATSRATSSNTWIATPSTSVWCRPNCGYDRRGDDEGCRQVFAAKINKAAPNGAVGSSQSGTADPDPNAHLSVKHEFDPEFLKRYLNIAKRPLIGH